MSDHTHPQITASARRLVDTANRYSSAAAGVLALLVGQQIDSTSPALPIKQKGRSL